MSDRARELLARAGLIIGEYRWSDPEDKVLRELSQQISAYFEEPEVKREQFSDDVVADSYFQVQPILGEYLKFKAGFRMAEKMHGIGGEDE